MEKETVKFVFEFIATFAMIGVGILLLKALHLFL